MFHYERLVSSVHSFSKVHNSKEILSIPNSGTVVQSKRNVYTNRMAFIAQRTVIDSEVEKFHKCASEWWKSSSRFTVLKSMNAVRVPFVRDGLLSNAQDKKIKSGRSLEGFRIVDVGCGGVFFSEALARLGANVTGVDPSSENVRVATVHASLDPALKDNLTYVCSTPEELVGTVEPFDALVCSEVIEHVANPDFFVECCANLVKDKGSLFFTTVDKGSVSYVFGILVAEYMLGLIPRGTLDWNKFVSPLTLQKMLECQHCQTQVVRGIVYNPFTGKCLWSSSTSLQYALHAIKMVTACSIYVMVGIFEKFALYTVKVVDL